VITRRLGRTGHQSSVAVLGGAAFARATSDEALAGFRSALSAGVNHLDIAPRYGDAQRLIGPLLPAVRNKLFVACKTARHRADGVRAQLEESLTVLGCQQFDLYQLHGVTDLDELERRVPAAEAILRARDEGLCRYVGITGHNVGTPAAQAEALRRWDLDTVMFPVFPRVWADGDFRRDAEALPSLCVDRDVGVMAIKAAAARPWRDEARHATTWYEPYVDDDSLARGTRFALSTPGVHALCTPGDLALLPRVLAAVETDAPMTAAEREAAIADVAGEDLIFPIPTG
jgi:aryl-alcohol dehydrogenase-like predicted oxidoreductase